MARRVKTSLAFEVVTALPGSPVDGEICYYQNAAMAVAGVVWSFRYNSASALANKWEFIGGNPLSDQTAGGANVRSAYAAITTGPGFSVPLAGLYEVDFSVEARNNSAGNACNGYVALGVNAAEQAAMTAPYVCGTLVAFGVPLTRKAKLTLAAADALTLRSFSTSSISTNLLQPAIFLRPLRV